MGGNVFEIWNVPRNVSIFTWTLEEQDLVVELKSCLNIAEAEKNQGSKGPPAQCLLVLSDTGLFD